MHNPKTFWGMGKLGDTPNPARRLRPLAPNQTLFAASNQLIKLAQYRKHAERLVCYH